MAMTDSCGPHCGIRAGDSEGTVIHEGHCGCGMCHNGPAPAGSVTSRGGRLASAGHDGSPAIPMCARWYQASGGIRPWEPGAL